MTSRGRRVAATLSLAVAVVASSTGSCRGVVVGNPQDGVSALCDLLARCYGPAAPKCSDLDDRFARASDGVNDVFLRYLTTNECLASCSAAKECWDHAPVCLTGATMQCSNPEDCCGFTRGLASCDGTRTAPGACCIPHAVQCSPEAPACCHGEKCYTPVPGQPATCGGVPPCADAGAGCKSGFDCCSKRCSAGGVCEAQNVCQPEGGACVSSSDCCGGEDLSCTGAAGSKHCAKPTMCAFGSACTPPTALDPGEVPCTPGSPDACCGDPNACVADESGLAGVCVDFSKPIVLPDGFACSSDANCCSRFCDTTTTPLCAEPRTCAIFDPSCYPTGCGSGSKNACTTNGDCCSNQCVNDRCTCGVSTCHSALEMGPPIACPNATPTPSCVDKVCAEDPFCCCTAWDELCVAAASAHGCP